MELLELILAFGIDYLLIGGVSREPQPGSAWRIVRRMLGGVTGALIGLAIGLWVGGAERAAWGAGTGALGGFLAVLAVDFVRGRRD